METKTPGDHRERFSQSAASYAKYRPGYPDELFEFLSAHTVGHDLVWDVATGNGQAARSLARFYSKVIATDSSSEQLRYASADAQPNVEFKHANAELTDAEIREIGLPIGGVDLITVATAVHWFDIGRFHDVV